MSKKILMLDLDGTLVVTRSGKEFPKDSDDWMFRPEILGRILRFLLINSDCKHIAIITNQGGIDLGYVTPTEVDNRLDFIAYNLNIVLTQEFGLEHEYHVEFFVCPSMRSPRRKPGEIMLKEAMKWAGCKAGQAVMVGDASGKTRRGKEIGVAHIIDGKIVVTHDRLEKEGNKTCPKHIRVQMTEDKFEAHLTEYSLMKGFDKDRQYKLFTTKKDHSDSDMGAAKNARVEYVDVEEWIAQGNFSNGNS